MKIKTITCLIMLGPMTTISKEVWAWEAEVLKEKFGGQCDFHKKGEANISELPGVEEEFSRMHDAHGVEEDTRVAHVVNTFGRGKAGIIELRKAMKKAVVKVRKASKKVAAKKPAAKAEGKTEKDPLA